MIAKKKIVNRTNITEHLIEHQLNMIGKTIKEIEEDELWYVNNTFTDEQFIEFKKYSIPLLKKVFKFNKAKAEKTFDWFNLQFGLKILNN
jgi:hypothetical protein